ncbi:hypothetical protein C3L33_07791, partial [Rhododendron williamsianum]
MGFIMYLLTFSMQPLMDNLEAQTYETFEKDTVKYSQYERAVSKALLDRISDEEASTKTTVLMVVGAGRGPLVRASLQAAEETGRKLRVYAVEKNPNAVITLHNLVKLEGWENIVTIVSCDMRCWDAPEKADILVSELLGSFGDNELSPECLDGAQRFLKADGISIPSSYVSMFLLHNVFLFCWCAHCSYTSFIQPVTASKLYNDVNLLTFCIVKSHKDLVHFETAYVVKLHRVARLAPSQPVSFSFWRTSLSLHLLILSTQPQKTISAIKSFSLRFPMILDQSWFMVCGPKPYHCSVSNIFPIEDTSVCTVRFAFRITALAVLWFNQGIAW